MDFIFCNCFCLSHSVAGDWKKKKNDQKSLIAILFLKGRYWLIQLQWLQLDQLRTVEVQRQMEAAKPYRQAPHQLQPEEDSEKEKDMNRIYCHRILRGYPKPDVWKRNTLSLVNYREKSKKTVVWSVVEDEWSFLSEGQF